MKAPWLAQKSHNAHLIECGATVLSCMDLIRVRVVPSSPFLCDPLDGPTMNYSVRCARRQRDQTERAMLREGPWVDGRESCVEASLTSCGALFVNICKRFSNRHLLFEMASVYVKSVFEDANSAR